MRPSELELSTARGALLGACIGDAAGAVLEFMSTSPTTHDVARALTFPGGGCWRVAAGQITDDGELTLALADAIAEAGTFDEARVAQAYAAWFASRPFDIGQTTARAFGVSADAARGGRLCDTMRATARDYSMGSKANGSLMRATPLGLIAAGQAPEEAAALAHADSSLSHPNPACCDAVACYTIAIASLVETPGDRPRAWARALKWGRAHACPEVQEWLELALGDDDVPFTPQVGFVRIGFVHAFRHFLRGTPLAIALEETLLGGGDTDTNACIVGGLLGAASPAELQPAWIAAVTQADLSAGRERPALYHPRRIDALVGRILAAK